MKNILIADDELGMLKEIKFRLVKMGYEVIIASNGKEGLEKVMEIKPDLVFLDLHMPFLSGEEVCKLIKADAAVRHIPVILMTGSSEGVTQENILAIGADDQLLKPFEPEDLMAKIKKFIG